MTISCKFCDLKVALNTRSIVHINLFYAASMYFHHIESLASCDAHETSRETKVNYFIFRQIRLAHFTVMFFNYLFWSESAFMKITDNKKKTDSCVRQSQFRLLFQKNRTETKKMSEWHNQILTNTDQRH